MPDHTPFPSQAAATAAAEIERGERLPDEEDWLHEEEASGLPRRPRRRLLTPLSLSLLAVLLLACGFIGGVLVQKGQSSSGAGAGGSGLAARFAALRAGAGATGGIGKGAAAGSTGNSEAGDGFPGRAERSGAGATVGQVAFVKGNTLYVTDTDGNTVKVKAAAGATVSRTATTSVKAIHPGETVLVAGTAASNGTVDAQSIRVGATGGLGSLVGTGGASSSGTTPTSGSSSTGEPALFGRG